MSAGIHKLTMPKWGLSMTEGKVVEWLVDDGTEVEADVEIVEIETEKVSSALEAPRSGVLRWAAGVGESVPVAGLVGVIAEASVPGSEIDAFVATFQESFVPEEVEEEVGGPAPETLEVNGQTLRYLRRGEGGEPAILIHGFGGDLNNWLFNHEVLAAGRSVYAIDLPGHGASSKQLESGNLAEFTGTLATFMDAIGVPQAHLVGHSMGGAVALDLALSHPGRALSLVLIAPAGLGPEVNGDYIEGFITASRRRDLKPHIEKLFADPATVSRQLIDDILKYKRIDGVPSALRTIAAALFPQGRQTVVLHDRLAELSVPTTILWGGDDRILPVSHARDLPENVEVQIVQGQGHMVQMEAPAEVNRSIVSCWNRSQV
jgi:pyruvate dehydrogenase E2 component (dihydrolipoamide acetyltransferase)